MGVRLIQVSLYKVSTYLQVPTMLLFLTIRLIPPTNKYNLTMEELSQVVGMSLVNGKNNFDTIIIILNDINQCAIK